MKAMSPDEDGNEIKSPSTCGSDEWYRGEGAEASLHLGPPPSFHGNPSQRMAVVEALLLVSPEPLSVAMISGITGFEQGAVREMLNRLSEEYRRRDGGVVVREVAGGFGFYAVPAAAPFISRLIKSQVNPRLTRASMETLAIVAYLQPVSRGTIAEIRGVHSESVVKTLEERGLVAEVGRGSPPGYPALYGTTSKFLERFGLNGLDELPPLEKFAPDPETVEKIKRSLSWELAEEADAGDREAGEDTEGSGESWSRLTPDGGEADPRRQGDD